MQRLVQILSQSKGHGESLKGSSLISGQDQSALGLSRPVSSGRHHQPFRMQVGEIRIDTGDIPVSFGVRKGITAGFVQIFKGKAAQVTQNINDLHISSGHTVHIQMYRLLNPVAPVAEFTHLRFQIPSPEHAGTGIEPRLIVVEGIDFDIAEPVNQRMTSVAFRPHIGRTKRHFPLRKVIKHLLPALTVIHG